jgi:hypothetical protein
MNVQSNWWENFFEGAAVDLWLRAMSAEHTTKEADSLDRLLELPGGGEVLDIPCGGGRLALARRLSLLSGEGERRASQLLRRTSTGLRRIARRNGT